MKELKKLQKNRAKNISRLHSQPPIVLMLIVPFALVINSAHVELTTQIYQDGSGLRQITAEADSYFKRNMDKWSSDVETEHNWQVVQREDSATKATSTITRNLLISGMDKIGTDGTPHIVDVFQKPLSIYTTYKWSERITFQYRYDTNSLEARAGGHYMDYTVRMPGVIMDATCNPMPKARVSTSGGEASFRLDASEPLHTVTVTSRRVRWEYLAIVAYIAAFIFYRIGKFTALRMRSRPKRI